MALTNFRLLDTTTKALFFQGDTIPLDKIDDALAEKLLGKTHVLERLAPEHTPAPTQAQLGPASEPTAPALEAGDSGKKKD